MPITLDELKTEDAADLERLQEVCYPTIDRVHLLRRSHFEHHARLFPQGTIVAREDGRIVGLSSGFLLTFDFAAPQHTFDDITAGGSFARHDPAGLHYYGADVSVHPSSRGRGIGRALYDARKQLVRRLKRRGIVAGGLLPGFARYRHDMNVAAYVEAVVAGTVYDPTLTFQLRNGYRVRGILEDYLSDSASGNYAALIYWQNPDLEG